MTMTDTETTIAGEAAAATALLRDIAQNLDGIAEEIASIRDNAESIRAHIGARDLTQSSTQGANASVSAHASTPGDYGSPQNPREGIQQARGATFTPTPPTRTGDTVDAPQNAIQSAAMGEVGEDPDDYEPYDVFQPDLAEARHAAVPEVEFPSGPDESLWWVQGMDGDQPVEGVGILSRGRFYALDGEWSIYPAYGDDRLYEATRVVAIPADLLRELYDSTSDTYGRALDAIHQIEDWAVDHGQTGE
jgi:hypothetical protein